MPKVQVYQPQIAEQSLQIPLQNLDHGNGSLLLAKGASNFAQGMENIAGRMQEEDDAAVIKERINNYRTKSLATMEEYQQVMGRDAYDSRVKVTQSLEEYAKTLGSDLTGRQAAGFNAAVQDYILRDKAAVSGHATQQRTTWLNGQDEALVAIAQEDYVAKPDPIYEQQIRSATANLANRNGWAPEKQQLYAEEKISEANVAIVNQYLESSPAQAATFYRDNKDKILPSMRAPLEKQIVEEGRLAQQQAVVETLLVKYGTDKKAGLAEIRANYSGKDEDRMVARWNARVSEIDEYNRISANDAVRGGIDKVWKEGIDSITPDEASYLKSLGKWELIQDEHYAKVSGNPQYDDHAWLAENYYNLPVDQQLRVPDEDLKAHTKYDTFAQLNEFRQKQYEPVVTQTTNDVIKRELARYGIEVGNVKDDDQRERVNAFYGRYDKEVQVFTEQNKRAPTTQEQQAIVRQISAESDLYVDKGIVWDSVTKGPRFEVETETNLLELSDELDLPPEDIQSVMEYMNRKGIPLTRSNLLQTYQAGSQ